MKTLNITLMVNATTLNNAETIGKNELMEFAKIIGMRSGSFMAHCEGNATHIANNDYEINATVQVDGCGDVSEIIKEAQRNWSAKPDIMQSIIFVTEEKQKPRDYEAVTCESCGQVMVKGYENIINPGTANEYYLCNMCHERDDDVIECEGCESYIDVGCLVKNPVTGENDLCPCCGNKLVF